MPRGRTEGDWDGQVAPSVIEPETFGTENEQDPTVLYIPTAHAMRGDQPPPVALRELDNGDLAMLAYTSGQTFVEGCGTEQPYIAILPEAVQAFQHVLGADVVLWDAVIDPLL